MMKALDLGLKPSLLLLLQKPYDWLGRDINTTSNEFSGKAIQRGPQTLWLTSYAAQPYHYSEGANISNPQL